MRSSSQTLHRRLHEKLREGRVPSAKVWQYLLGKTPKSFLEQRPKRSFRTGISKTFTSGLLRQEILRSQATLIFPALFKNKGGQCINIGNFSTEMEVGKLLGGNLSIVITHKWNKAVVQKYDYILQRTSNTL
jgi:hypothetical protein